MNSFDMHSRSKGVIGLAQGTISTNTDTNGASVDRSGYSAVEWFVYSQTITDGAYVVKIQDSPDNSVWTDASSGEVLGFGMAFALTEDNTVKRIGYHGSERYVRAVITSTAVTTGGLFSAVAIKSTSSHGPVADD